MTEATDLQEWRVTGMDCGSCAAKVRGAVEALPGVEAVEVTLMNERLRLRLDAATTSRESVETAVRRLGFGISVKGAAPEKPKGGFVLPEGAFTGTEEFGEGSELPAQSETPPADPAWYATVKGRYLIATGVLLTSAWIVKLLVGGQIAHWVFMLATVISVAPVIRRAALMARARMPFTIEMLMSIAAIGALFLGAAEEAALVVFLFAVGEMLEGVAASRARGSIRALADLVPQTARLVVGDRISEVAADSLAIGQIVQARPGDRIPADGTIVSGSSGVDESPVTGESVPVLKEPGEAVFAGSINTEGELRIRVEKAAEDNTISRILHLVEEAESARAPVERFIDRFSRVYMPAVVGVALLAAVVPPLVFGAPWETWIYRGLALLLIGCPCALVISVPAAVAAGLSTGARHGLLMKGGAVMETAAKTSLVAFDKTGTLTEGRPQITDLVPLHGDEVSLLATAAAVETGSSHPLAQAILARAEERGIAVPQAMSATTIPGRGARAVIASETWHVGAPRLATEAGVLTEADRAAVHRLESAGKTVVTVFTDERLLGLIALRDEPRADAAEAIAALKRMGIGSVMLTGDNPVTGRAIADGLGIEARAGLLPEDKVTEVRALARDAHVMMVGDGINDAPALASAHLGIAMGSGTHVALETADGALLRDRVLDVPRQIRLARATMANIRQNVAIALGLKGVFLVTTLLGVTGLWIAVMADTGATVLVTMNALRLLGFRGEPKEA
ncbi:Cd2+/Zn2+-exporting ATPase [Thioclava sp. ES.031]|uniref:heavy metal translocating P-type ATPase n=1 Tax=Thioclava sp. ES.031 TaxID=1798203 RepID=UPI000BF4AC85|nr:heavy metal translocating P-type ATPase [Thioclava sp. ES.031]PFG65104.1 Cd2+/Zn2+-exporting ATPase [Thioclava sp. ES.031]